MIEVSRTAGRLAETLEMEWTPARNDKNCRNSLARKLHRILLDKGYYWRQIYRAQ